MENLEKAYNQGVEEWLQKHPDLQHEATFAGIAQAVGCSFSTARDLWDGTAVLYESKPLPFSELVARIRSYLLNAPERFYRDRRVGAYGLDSDVFLADEKYRHAIPFSIESDIRALDEAMQDDSIRREAELEAAKWCRRNSQEHAERTEALLPFVKVKVARQIKNKDWLAERLSQYMPEPPNKNKWHLYALHGQILLGKDDEGVKRAMAMAEEVDSHNLRAYNRCVCLQEKLDRLLKTADEILTNPPTIPLRKPEESRHLRNLKSLTPAKVFGAGNVYSTPDWHGNYAVLVFRPAPPDLARWLERDPDRQCKPPASEKVEALREKLQGDTIRMQLIAVEELIGMPLALLRDETEELITLNLLYAAWVMKLFGDVTFARPADMDKLVGAYKGDELVAAIAPVQTIYSFPGKADLQEAVRRLGL